MQRSLDAQGVILELAIAANLDTNVAYVFGSAFWGRGIATRAVAQMLQIVAAEFGVRRFIVVADRRNTRSVRLAERLGFVEMPPQQAADRIVAATDILMHKVLP